MKDIERINPNYYPVAALVGENAKNVFEGAGYATKDDIIRIHNNRAYHVSAVASPLDYPLIIVTNKYCFCLHSIEKNINADDVLKEL